MVSLLIMRHGATPGNERRIYVGKRTDESLSKRGKEQCRRALVDPAVPKVYVSPMLRARQTASICFPSAHQIPVPGLEEFDFGVFEGRSAQEMEDDEQYRAWVESGCVARCPEGEMLEDFMQRSNSALVRVLREAEQMGEQHVVVVAHGGTIMSAFSQLCREPRSYYGWHVDNCCGYAAQARFDGDQVLLEHSQLFAPGKIGPQHA